MQGSNYHGPRALQYMGEERNCLASEGITPGAQGRSRRKESFEEGQGYETVVTISTQALPGLIVHILTVGLAVAI